ncbi:MAG: ankyrin repeat domain-containing protein [Rickettsiaceae bacterium H1]|nr:ankyrin repeat domain-containing protein [Rickettsiaceae bacterium H1]
MLAAKNGHMKVVDLLLQRDADVNVKDTDNRTALIWAAMKNHMEVVGVLINSSVDVNVKNRNGKTAYDLANNEIKALLINKFPEIERHFYKKEIKKGAKFTVIIAAVAVVGAIVVSVLGEMTNLIGNKLFMENKTAIIAVSCLAAAGVIVAALGSSTRAIKAKTQIDTVKAEAKQLLNKALS